MSARRYLAWNMLAAAAYQDERLEQGNFQAAMRKRIGNPLEHISDNNFIKEYRLNKEGFEDLCDLLEHYTDLKSTQRVSLESKVLCALLFYAHGSYQRVTGKAKHFSQEAISVFIEEVTMALNHPNVLKRFIKFPTTRQERDTIKQSFYSKYGIPGVIGCIDGSHFKIFTPCKEVEHLYYCRKHYHSMNVQMICDHSCLILSVNAKFGGATHDAFIWENSSINNYMQSLHRHNEMVWLLGDSGYPQRPWLMTPYLNPASNSIEEAFNALHTSARVVIENTFGRLKNRWRCVHRDRTLHYRPEKCARIIIACCVLHNIALKYNVPEPEETDIVSGQPQGVSGYLPAVCTSRTAESDAWTLHRAVSLGHNSNSGDCKSESDSNTDVEMATNFPHEDVPQLGLEKSEDIYKEWEKYWMTVQTTKVDGILSVTQGQSINWNLTGNGEVNAKSARDKQDRRWIFGLRHGERVDLTYGKWTEHCFGENDTYIRRDLNLPLSLPPRVAAKDAYYKDTPLTRMGRFQAYLVGEGLRLAGVSVRHVYASAALRCIETADSFLEGLQAGPSVKVKVEPGLFEYKVWHAAKGMAPFMTPKELYKAGYNVDPDYKAYVDLDINSTETLDEFYLRNEKIMQTVVKDTEAEGGNIIFVGHASTLDMMATALSRLSEGNPEPYSYQVSKNLLRVPYCALGAMRDKPWEIVAPPCPPSINSSSGRFDWRILKN